VLIFRFEFQDHLLEILRPYIIKTLPVPSQFNQSGHIKISVLVSFLANSFITFLTVSIKNTALAGNVSRYF